ncbi:MAG: c-type cytochrome domain-containing protein [Ilyomonas sp.]
MFYFLGRLHPALVHLPIGILLIALLLIWLSSKKYNISYEAIKIVLLIGMLTAVLSCITGYALSMHDDYDKMLVSWHMWMGIGVAVASMLLYVRFVNKQFDISYKILCFALIALIFITGHLGGELTHGSNFLSFGTDTVAIDAKPITNVQEAKVYRDIVQPIFYKQCYSCHGPNRQKGGLRMDDFSLLMKGGKDGKVISVSDADKSELIKRLLLPKEDEHHMPPKEKSQLNEKQIALLHWWIEHGADTAKYVKELPQPEKLKPILLALQNAHPEIKAPSNIPSVPVEKADDKAILRLQNKGVIVMPVAQNSNYLMANFVTATNIHDTDLALLQPVKKQLVWLKIGDTNISDNGLKYISECSNLMLLQLNNTAITDRGLKQLDKLQQLQSLNLVATNVTADGVSALKNLKQLHSLYLYQTKVKKEDWPLLKKQFPKTALDSGGYFVPLFSTDTTEVKAQIQK